LFFGGVLTGRQDGVEDVLGVGAGYVLLVYFLLCYDACTLACFLPAVETSTGLEYLTNDWGWLKLAWLWVDWPAWVVAILKLIV